MNDTTIKQINLRQNSMIGKEHENISENTNMIIKISFIFQAYIYVST